MTVIRNNSISGINSITAQSGALNFYDSTGNTLSIGADVTGGVTVATGATISGSTNTIVASTNGIERVRIDTNGNVGIGTDNVTIGSASYKALQVHSGGTNSYLVLTNNSSGTDASNDGVSFVLTGSDVNVLNRESGNILLSTNGGERARVTSGGNVQIANGNLVFSTSGTGIDFSATADGGTTTPSELLDDYEEGTFTPTFTAGTVSGGYTRQVGEYTKVGRLVTFTLTIDGDGNLQGAAQAIEIGGLPFTSRNVAEIGGAQVTYPGNFDTTNNRRFWLVAQNNTTLSYRDSSANNINGNAVNNVNSQLNLCGYYFTDA